MTDLMVSSLTDEGGNSELPYEEMAATFRSGAWRLLPAAARLREPAVPKKGSPSEEIIKVFYQSKKKLGWRILAQERYDYPELNSYGLQA
jgi:hypothetical protein